MARTYLSRCAARHGSYAAPGHRPPLGASAVRGCGRTM